MRQKKKKKKKKSREADRETDKSECLKEGDVEKVFDGRTQQWKDGGKKGKEGERSSPVHAPLSMQQGFLPGGTQTLSPCPALYSPGYCSQINLAGYPV